MLLLQRLIQRRRRPGHRAHSVGGKTEKSACDCSARGACKHEGV